MMITDSQGNQCDDYGNRLTGPPPDYTGRQDKSARGSGLDIFKSAFPDHAALEEWARTGLAFTLQSGRIMPGATAAQVNDAITRCKGSLGHGGDWDSPSLRSFLETRSKALGMTIPVWPGVDSSGYAGSNPGQGPAATPAGKSVRYPAFDALVAKSAAAQSVATAMLDLAAEGRLGDLERDIGRMRRETGSGRAQLTRIPGDTRAADGPAAAGRAYAESQRYADLAKSMSDPVSAECYREKARELRKAAGL